MKFSEIEKSLKIRSNMVAYHIECMIKEGLLVKKGNYYALTKAAEKYIPILPHITGSQLSPLPVVLVAVLYEKNILLIKRNKRPYKDHLSMIGGKIGFDEGLESASLRLVKEKTGLDGKFYGVNTVFYEHVKNNDEVIHSFMLFMTTVHVFSKDFSESEHGSLAWFSLRRLGKPIIPSDHWLIKNKLDSFIDVREATLFDNDDKLTMEFKRNN